MNHTTQTVDDQKSTETPDKLQTAYDLLGESLRSLDPNENKNTYKEIQEIRFNLKAAMKAKNGEFQEIDLPGTDLNIIAEANNFEEKTVIRTNNGVIEIPSPPLKYFRTFDSLQVCNPENPHHNSVVTIDHVISTEGDIEIQVNGTDLQAL